MRVQDVILLVGMVVGHIGMLCYSLNWWYAHAFPRRFLRTVKLLHGGLVLVGVAAFLSAPTPFRPWSEPWLSGSLWEFAAGSYGLICLGVGLLLIPGITLQRRWKGPPPLLISNHTRTINVVEKLGYKPLGRGKHRLLAQLPGNEVFQVDLAERTLVVPRLPAAWNGLSILHISDLHFVGSPDKTFYQCVIDCCRDWAPDLVALTGDVVDSEQHHRWIVPVLGRLRWGVAAFAILGNHDYRQDASRVRRRLGKLGMRVLGNSWQEMELRGHPLVAIGNETPWFRPAPDMTSCPAGFRLCLSHTPDNIRWAQDHEVDLMLAGHNHGGQIRFPLLGSVLVPSRFGRRFDCGTFDEPPTILHVSRGLGGEQPLRYHCRPEITKLILRCAADAEIDRRRLGLAQAGAAER